MSTERIAVMVTVDTDDLRRWANWHADRGHHGVAHVLYKAANDGESLTDQALREARADAWDEGVRSVWEPLAAHAWTLDYYLDDNPHRDNAPVSPDSEATA